ncbi:MAG TPA: hypothetical protein VI566_14320 [Xanthomonadales bacterium]|nr:hypothetical protein [Xanthomonadales bacterium]
MTVGRKRRLAPVLPGSGLTLAFLATASLMLWVSFDLSRTSAWIPQLVLAFTVMLLLLQLSAELLAARAAPTGGETPAAGGRGARVVHALAWISLLMLASWLLGTALGSALFCFAWLRWHAGDRWLVSLAIAGGLGLVLWLLFVVLFGVGLYAGVLWPLLR